MRLIPEATAQPFLVYAATHVPDVALNAPAAWLKPWRAHGQCADGVRRIHEAPVPAGRALPLIRARFRAGVRQAEAAVGPGAEEVRFEMALPPGPVDLQAWFANEAGDQTRGVYYL